jgi:hypothetical protein
MTTLPTSVTTELVDAILARDFPRARGLLHPDIDFRAMTPSRVWEADGPAGVEEVLRTWLDDPDEEIASVEPTGSTAVEDTVRVGWLVHGSDANGPFTFEQQAYVREHDGQVGWLRVMCSGARPPGAGA